MITFKMKGNFAHTENFFSRMLHRDLAHRLEPYAQKGLEALKAHTPVDSGKTRESWDYTISRTKNSITITWTNSNTAAGVPIAVLVQYGHATGNGGYVYGTDYINPALKPVFHEIAESVWEEVTRS